MEFVRVQWKPDAPSATSPRLPETYTRHLLGLDRITSLDEGGEVNPTVPEPHLSVEGGAGREGCGPIPRAVRMTLRTGPDAEWPQGGFRSAAWQKATGDSPGARTGRGFPLIQVPRAADCELRQLPPAKSRQEGARIARRGCRCRPISGG